MPGATLALYAKDVAELAGVDALTVASRTGSAIIQAAVGGSIVAIVNEDNRGVCTASSCGTFPANYVGFGSTYEAFADGKPDKHCFLHSSDTPCQALLITLVATRSQILRTPPPPATMCSQLPRLLTKRVWLSQEMHQSRYSLPMSRT